MITSQECSQVYFGDAKSLNTYLRFLCFSELLWKTEEPVSIVAISKASLA